MSTRPTFAHGIDYKNSKAIASREPNLLFILYKINLHKKSKSSRKNVESNAKFLPVLHVDHAQNWQQNGNQIDAPMPFIDGSLQQRH